MENALLSPFSGDLILNKRAPTNCFSDPIQNDKMSNAVHKISNYLFEMKKKKKSYKLLCKL